MSCITYNGENYSEIEFRDYINNNPEEFAAYTQPVFLDASIDYKLKAVDILATEHADKVFRTGDKNDWTLEKILTELQIPKAQKDLILTLGTRNRGEIVVNLLANYSYTVEIETATDQQYEFYDNQRDWDLGDPKPKGELPYIVMSRHDGRTIEGYNTPEEARVAVERLNRETVEPSQHYVNMTVSGGVNYTENEIRTPDITPAIEGHAAFATNKGIGWFRSDDKGLTTAELTHDWDSKAVKALFTDEEIAKEKEKIKKALTGSEPKTRRILEIQSDLFQKGRDRLDLTDNLKKGFKFSTDKGNFEITDFTTTDVTYKNIDTGTSGTFLRKEFAFKLKEKLGIDVDIVTNSENQFLQLLNKDNNWINFFVKAIIQDSARKGYEKVLFPSGNTAAKVEGHETVEEFIKSKEYRLVYIKQEQERYRTADSFNYRDNFYEVADQRFEGGVENPKAIYYLIQGARTTKEKFEEARERIVSNFNTEINQISKEIEDAKQGKLKISAVAKFYEDTIKNVLDKRGYKPERIKDEHGNEWYQVDLKPEYSGVITLDVSINDVEDKIRKLYKPFTHSTWENGIIQLNGRSNQLNRGRIAGELMREFGFNTLKGALEFSENQSKKGIKYRTITINRDGIAKLLTPQGTIFLDSSISDLEEALKSVSTDQAKFESQMQRLIDESAKVNKIINKIDEESLRSKLRDSLKYIKEENKELKNFVYFLLEAQEVLKYYSENLKKISTLPIEKAVPLLSTADQISRSFKDMITFLKKDFRYVDEANEFKGLVNQLSNYYDQIQNIYASEAEVLGASIIEQELAPDAKLAFQKLSKDLKETNEQIQKAIKAGAKDSYVTGLNKKAELIKKRIIELVPDADTISETFKGLRGDLNWFTGQFRSTLAMGDPIVSGYSRRLKRGYNQVRSALAPLRNQAQGQLEAYKKAVGVTNNSSMADFYKGLYKIQNIDFYDDKGEKQTESYYSLLAPINQNFDNDDKTYIQAIRNAKKTGDLKEIEKAQKAYSDWLNKYTERQYNEAWYDRYNLLTKEANEARQSILDEMNNILRGPNRDALSDIDLERVADLKYDLKRLSTIYNEDGKLKTGEDLEIAKSIQAFNKKTAEMSYWETTDENRRWFNIILNKKKEQVQKGLITQASFDAWFSANTQRNISQEFYKQRKVIIDKIDSITKKLPKKEFGETTGKLWDGIFDVSRPYRDEDNILDGGEFTPEEKAVVRSNEEALEEIKSKLIRFSGLSIKEEEELSGLWGALDTLSDQEVERFVALREQSSKYKDYLSNYVSRLELTALMTYFGQLGELSKWESTPYYKKVYNDKLHEFRMKVDRNMLKDMKYIEERFQSEDPWYKDNHISKTKKIFNDGKTFFQTVSEPLYIWKDIIPTNEAWIEQDAPGFAFKTRIVKPDFVNKNYESSNFEYYRISNPEDFRKVPKRYINDSGEVKQSSYINEDYERLKDYDNDKDKAKWNMLQFLINTHLVGQDKLPEYKRLGYFLPGINKDNYDRAREQGLRGIKNSVLDTVRVTQTDRDLTLGDISQVDLSIIPIKYSTKIKPENQDLDLLGGILKHRMGIEEYSYLEKELPYAKLIQSGLRTAQGDVSQTQIDRVLTNLGFDKYIKPTKESLRSKAFDSFLRTMFYGETEISPFNNDQWNKIIGSAFGVATLQVLTFNFPAHVTNILSGEVQNIIEAAGGKYMTLKDYFKAKSLYAANVGNFWNDYGKEGNKTFWTALSEKLDVPSGEFLDQYGQKTNFSRIRDLKNHIMFIKQGGEHEIQVSTMMAMALNYKVKLGDKMVSLDKALELVDGQIKIKAGADLTEAQLNEFQDRVHSVLRQLNGAYSKIDKSMAEKSFLGRLAFYMRKYFLPMAYRRFEPFKYDYEERDFKEGYYQTAFRFIRDLVKLNGQMLRNWDTYKNTMNETEKRNLRRFASEILIIATLGLTILAIGGYDDDRELKGHWGYAMAVYELMKVKSEAETLLPGPGFNEISSIFSSPFVMANTAKTGVRTLNDLIGWRKFKVDYGIWEEGDLRIKADALKLIGVPVNLWTPELMVKNFELRNR